MTRRPRACLLLASLLLLHCRQGPPRRAFDDAMRQTWPQRFSTRDVEQNVTRIRDTWHDPCDDFYAYACGRRYWRWNLFRPSITHVHPAFTSAEERTAVIVWQVLTEARDANEDPGRGDPVAPQLAHAQAFLAQCLDERALRRARTAPLDPWLTEIRAIRDLSSFTAVVGELHAIGVPALFSYAVNPAAITPGVYGLELSQGGLGLGPAKLYLTRDFISQQHQARYRAALERTLALTLSLTGDSRTAGRLAADVFAFETAIARLWLTPAGLEDAPGSYEETDCAGLQQKVPELSWTHYCAALGISESARITLVTPSLFSRLGHLVAHTSIDVLRAYLQVMFVHDVIDLLADAVATGTYGGPASIFPRWQRCAAMTYGAFPEVLEPLYAERLRSREVIDRVAEIAQSVRRVFPAMLDGADWMDGAVRTRAKARIASAQVEIGLPARNRTADRFVLAPTFFESALAARRAVFAEHMRWVGRPVDAQQWILPPLTANAFFVPARNAVFVPLGVLQTPLFHPDFPAAMNFGAIGSLLGHEIAHAVQPRALHYHPSGRVDHSWTAPKSERSDTRSRCIVTRYKFRPASRHIDRNPFELPEPYDAADSLQEILADVDGVTAAYRAYKQSTPVERQSGLADLSGDQLFFLAFAQMLCSDAPEPIERILAQIDTHAPPRVRVNGALANVPAFAAVFGCSPGSKMYPEAPCEGGT